jgi:hypothetical protein
VNPDLDLVVTALADLGDGELDVLIATGTTASRSLQVGSPGLNTRATGN